MENRPPRFLKSILKAPQLINQLDGIEDIPENIETVINNEELFFIRFLGGSYFDFFNLKKILKFFQPHGDIQLSDKIKSYGKVKNINLYIDPLKLCEKLFLKLVY